MEREHLPGTIRIWTGTAEELVGTKAYYIRAGLFKDVDVALFTHVGDNLDVSWGDRDGTGLVSVQYPFHGETAHAAGAPWRGRSALDAVELMDVGWNFRREHLPLEPALALRHHRRRRPAQRRPAHRVRLVLLPRRPTIAHIKELWEIGDRIAKGAAMMTGIELLPTEGARQRLAAALQQGRRRDHVRQHPEGRPADVERRRPDARQGAAERAEESASQGLSTKLSRQAAGAGDGEQPGGGSDDIGDISWNVPTVTLRYPSNIPGLPGHNWANAISMATPIAHKGATAGAKVQAMTMLDLVLQPELVEQAWTYFRDVQTKTVKYEPLIRPQDKPAIWLNKATMDKYRPR